MKTLATLAFATAMLTVGFVTANPAFADTSCVTIADVLVTPDGVAYAKRNKTSRLGDNVNIFAFDMVRDGVPTGAVYAAVHNDAGCLIRFFDQPVWRLTRADVNNW